MPSILPVSGTMDVLYMEKSLSLPVCLQVFNAQEIQYEWIDESVSVPVI